MPRMPEMALSRDILAWKFARRGRQSKAIPCHFKRYMWSTLPDSEQLNNFVFLRIFPLVL